MVGFLTSSSTIRLYRGRTPRQSVWQFYVLPHMRQSWETMTPVSAGHIIPTPTQTVGSGRPLRESNPGHPHQESRALPLIYRAPLILRNTALIKINYIRQMTVNEVISTFSLKFVILTTNFLSSMEMHFSYIANMH